MERVLSTRFSPGSFSLAVVGHLVVSVFGGQSQGSGRSTLQVTNPTGEGSNIDGARDIGTLARGWRPANGGTRPLVTNCRMSFRRAREYRSRTAESVGLDSELGEDSTPLGDVVVVAHCVGFVVSAELSERL